MRHMTKLLLTATALSGLVAVPAFAQEVYPSPSEDATVVVIDQVVLGDVFSDMTVNVTPGATGAAAVATSTGNTSSALVENGDVDYDATQLQQGEVQAYSALVGGPVHGGSSTTVTKAYGNAATSSTANGTAFHTVTQTSDENVGAYSDIFLDGSDDVTATTTAAANVSTYSTTNGTNRGFTTQTGNADVTSVTNADLCCNNDYVALASTASGNTITSSGSTTTSYNGAVQTMDFGTNVFAETNTIVASGTAVNGSATASGNSVTVDNEWGYATLGRDPSEVYQGNGADVSARSTVELGTWTETSGSTAYGVGNSALISNVGSDTYLYANQENYGDVTGYATFDGATADGSHGYVSATAIGNAATATMCYTCGTEGILGGRTNQLNDANVTAYGVATSNGGYIQGAATAVGNSATYQSFGTE